MGERKKKPLTQWIVQNLFVLASIGITIANLWLVNRLSPVFKDIAVLAQRVSTLESAYTTIDKKLDQLIFMHLEK